jgi:hypothetical protein
MRVWLWRLLAALAISAVPACQIASDAPPRVVTRQCVPVGDEPLLLDRASIVYGLDRLVNDPSALEALANPHFYDLEAVRLRAAECYTIYRAGEIAADLSKDSPLDSSDPSLSALVRAGRLALHIGWVTTAAEGARIVQAGTTLFIKMSPGLAHFDTALVVDAAMASYREIAGRWEQWDLGIPQGFIYLWLTPDFELLRSTLGLAANEHAVCVPCRFITVHWSEDIDDFKMMFKHELSHAFCNCILGYQRAGQVPQWWTEGCATYLSGDVGGHPADTTRIEAGETVQVAVLVSPVPAYVEAGRAFQFIHEEYGEEKLGEFISMTVMEGSAGEALWKVLGISNSSTLLARAASYENTKARRESLVALYYVGLVFLGVALCRARGMLVGSITLLAAFVPLWFLSRMGHLSRHPQFPAVSNWALAGLIVLLCAVVTERCLRRYRGRTV